jgi:uncharacterized repeat protein (TIGR01451 family)
MHYRIMEDGNEMFTRTKEATMSRKGLIVVAVIAAMLVPALAMAAAKVTVSITAEKEIVVTENGKKVIKTVAAKEFVPGDTISYTVNYANTGNETATNAVIDDPVPLGTAYITDSATGAGADIMFSIDKGKTFKKPTLLFYEVDVDGKKVKKTASPDLYTDIRWTISSIPAGASGKVGFKVRVK